MSRVKLFCSEALTDRYRDGVLEISRCAISRTLFEREANVESDYENNFFNTASASVFKGFGLPNGRLSQPECVFTHL